MQRTLGITQFEEQTMSESKGGTENLGALHGSDEATMCDQ